MYLVYESKTKRNQYVSMNRKREQTTKMNQTQVLKPENLNIIQSAKRKAIFLDLDGTFWDRQVVPESAWRAVNQARENGHLVFVNTGRPAHFIPQFLWDAKLDGYCLAAGMDLYAKDQHLVSFYVKPELTKKMIQYLEEHGFGYALETAKGIYETQRYTNLHEKYFRSTGKEVKGDRHPMSEFSEELYSYVLKISFNSETEKTLKEPAAEIGFDILQYRHRFNPEGDDSDLYRGELTWNAHNKANAMETVLSAMNLDRDQYVIVAIGDAENDIPMLEAADYAICMGHANEEVQAVSDFKTTLCENQGIWNAFELLQVL